LRPSRWISRPRGALESNLELETFALAADESRSIELDLAALTQGKSHPASRVLLPLLQVFTPDMQRVEQTIAEPLYFHQEGDLTALYGDEVMREQFSRGAVAQAIPADVAEKLDSVRRIHVWAP
jgi:hypothetical protein